MRPRRDSHGKASINNPEISQKSRFYFFPSFFLENFPVFRKKKAPVLDSSASQRSDDLDVPYTDNPRRSYQKSSNMSGGRGSNVPPLLPSLSDSKMPRTKSTGKNSRKVLVAATPSPTKNSETGSIVKCSVNSKVNGVIASPSKSGKVELYSSSKYSNGKPSQSTQSEHGHYNGGSKLKDSPPEYSGSTTATGASVNTSTGYGGYDYSPRSSKQSGYQSKASATANSIIYGNAQQPPAQVKSSILGSMGFATGGSSSGTTSNYKTSASKLPHTSVISVKPIDDFGPSNTSSAYNTTTCSSSATSSVYNSSNSVGKSYNNNYNHSNVSVRDNSYTVYTGGSKSGAYGKSGKSNNILPTLPGTTSAAGAAAASSSVLPATTTTTTTASGAATSGKPKPLCCDKCDGKHETDNCPYYKKKREDHPDAQKNSYKMGGVSSLPGNTLYNARVVRQPGDGSCLFHSMSYGLPTKSNAARLRAEICQFIQSNPRFKISDTPLQDWVKWDSNSSVSEYARKMSRGSWGGGIEMACLSQMKDCNVHVYERSTMGYKRISAFDHPVNPETKPVVRVLYCGGVHYDALVS